MLVLLNMTGLKKIYWIPSYKADFIKELELWSFQIKFLFVEVTIHNKKAGAEIIKYLNCSDTWKQFYDKTN